MNVKRVSRAQRIRWFTYFETVLLSHIIYCVQLGAVGVILSSWNILVVSWIGDSYPLTSTADSQGLVVVPLASRI